MTYDNKNKNVYGISQEVFRKMSMKDIHRYQRRQSRNTEKDSQQVCQTNNSNPKKINYKNYIMFGVPKARTVEELFKLGLESIFG